MAEDTKARAEPLPHRGLGTLTDLILHQDTVTWTALSVFITGEFLLLALVFQSRTGVAVFPLGAVLTLVSLGVVYRSQTYLVAYFALAQDRVNERDREIFDVPEELLGRIGSRRWPSAFRMILFLHGLLLGFWVGLGLIVFVFGWPF